MDMFSGINYCPGYQERFQKALLEGDLKKAQHILETIPLPGLNEYEGVGERLAVMAIGYKCLAEHAMKTVDSFGKSIEDRREIKRYRDLIDSPEELEGMLREFRDLQTENDSLESKLASLKSKLASLQYSKL